MKRTQTATHLSAKKYTLGFGWSIILTVSAYIATSNEILNRSSLIIYISVLAMLQVFVQLYFFLNINQESKPRWTLWTFVSMSSILLIIVVGSLWIMHNLDYNMMPNMTSQENDKYMIQESSKGF